MDIPAERAAELRVVLQHIVGAKRIVLTTHVNADGDGSGCEAALAAWLEARGVRVRIINPTPFPQAFRFLIEHPEHVLDLGAPGVDDEIRSADLIVVLDLSEPSRVGRLGTMLRDRPLVVIDHHLPVERPFSAPTAQDPSACATGELIYDMLMLHDADAEWPAGVANGLYAAIVTDTGSFRFSNTTPRAHHVVADLLRRGVDPETMYRRIYATVPLKRVQLLRAALEHLEVDAESALAWITVPRAMMDDLGATSEDLDGLIEHARSVEGTEVALLFREMADGGVKVSFRSSGAVDVNALARTFGGGGHKKASGALVAGPLANARTQVLDAARAAVHQLEAHERAR